MRILERFLLRPRLKRTLAVLKTDGDLTAEQTAAVLTIEGSEAGLDSLEKNVRELARKSADEVRAIEDRNESVGADHPFMRWLWEHRQQIIEFVLLIVAKLMAGSQPEPVTESTGRPRSGRKESASSRDPQEA